MKQKTKEELVKENATLSEANRARQEENDERRRTLSNMLEAPFKKASYGYGESNERKIYSWPEIYFALGKLTQKQLDDDARGKIQQAVELYGDMNQRVGRLENPEKDVRGTADGRSRW